MTQTYKALTTILLELDLWYAEGVQKHLQGSEAYGDVGETLSAPISDYRDAVESYKNGQPIKKEGKELILKSLEQDREYTKMLLERLRAGRVQNPFILMPASHFAGLISEDIQRGIEDIKRLPERD